MSKHWCMFVMLMQKNASLWRLFCHRLPRQLPWWSMTPVGFRLEFFEGRLARKQDYQGRLSLLFWKVNDRSCHSQAEINPTNVLENCLFTWSWMGQINCAPNPYKVNLSFFFSSPEQRWAEGSMWATVIGLCPSCVNLLFKLYLLNHWSKFKITSHQCSPWCPLLKMA